MKTLAPLKLKRFAVHFKGRQIFVNAASHEEAAALARNRFVRIYREEEKPLDEGLGGDEAFTKAASIRESLRY